MIVLLVIVKYLLCSYVEFVDRDKGEEPTIFWHELKNILCCTGVELSINSPHNQISLDLEPDVLDLVKTNYELQKIFARRGRGSHATLSIM